MNGRSARTPSEHKICDGGKGILKDVARRVVPADVIDRFKGYFQVPALKYIEGLYLDWCAMYCESELTTAVALSSYDDKGLTRRILQRADLKVPEQISITCNEDVETFLKAHGWVVVKPARGEMGRSISVDLETHRGFHLLIGDQKGRGAAYRGGTVARGAPPR